MTELERELRALGASIEFPAAPDLTRPVRARLRERRPRRLVAAAAALVAAVAVGAAFAVPGSRSAILRFFGFANVRVTIVEKLPPVTSGPAATGERIDLAQAPQLLGAAPLLPDLGDPAAVYFDAAASALVVLYGQPTRLRFSEVHVPAPLIEKLATAGQVERLTVDGGRGLWIAGEHVLFDVFGQPRLAASTLIWEQHGYTLRLEARITKRQALEIAATVAVRNP